MNDIIMKKYGVGALLYSPALNEKLSASVIEGKFGNHYSLAICLEDTISEKQVPLAEQQLKKTLQEIKDYAPVEAVPNIFVRIREVGQMTRIWNMTRECNSLITGFIIPKYTITNAENFNKELLSINRSENRLVYMMPIIESKDIVNLNTRYDILYKIKDYLDSISELILNVRVGGNDFSNQFSVRRHIDETIYDIFPIANLLADIITVFGREYVVSGPVWEYFSSENDEWEIGLRNEIKHDILNGFIGKTVIHPKQISVVNDMLKVSRKDYEDALSILEWDSNSILVGKSLCGERMNEVKTHINWAKKIIALSQVYGIK